MQHKNPSLRALNPGAARRCELVKGADADTLYIYGIIGEDFFGDGISAKDVAMALQNSTAERLHVRINSPGGDVFDGVAMTQALRDYKGDVIAYVDGIAASAATLLITAAVRTEMAKGSMLMVHRAWTVVLGNTEDLAKQSALLAKIDGQIANVYAEHAGITPDAALKLMQDETWLTEDEAIAAGFADGLQSADPEADPDTNTEPANAALRQWDFSNMPFAHVPAALKVAPTPQKPAAKPINHNYHNYQRVRRLAATL